MVTTRIERLRVGQIGENTYAIDSQGIGVLIDPGDDAANILHFLDQKKFDISMIVLTHGHLDHIAAIPDLLEEWKGKPITVAIHPNDAGYLGENGEATNGATFKAVRAEGFFESFWKPMPAASLFLNEGDFVPGTTLLVMHTPGHSPGSICLYDREAGFLVSGDTLFRDGVGRVDTPDASPQAMQKSLARLALLPPETIVFPGHGPRTTIGREFFGLDGLPDSSRNCS
ncbi:MAG: MBL fold metallo-hydrolase [Spirochaetaceae bacterium]|nr:MBL fold metallo-hydrolase [Spirochaetaceae bacterium]